MKEWKVIIILSIAISVVLRLNTYIFDGIGNLDWLVDILEYSGPFIIFIYGVVLLLFGRSIFEFFIFAVVVEFVFLASVALYAPTGVEPPLEIETIIFITIAVKLFGKRKMFTNFFVCYVVHLLLGFLLLIITLAITPERYALSVIVLELLVGYFIYRTISSQKRTEITLIVISVPLGSLLILAYIEHLGNSILFPFFQEHYDIFLFILEFAVLFVFCVWGYKVQRKQITPTTA